MEEALEWVDWLTVELMPEADTEDATPEADVDADADADTVDDVEADIATEDEVCRLLRTPYQKEKPTSFFSAPQRPAEAALSALTYTYGSAQLL